MGDFFGASPAANHVPGEGVVVETPPIWTDEEQLDNDDSHEEKIITKKVVHCPPSPEPKHQDITHHDKGNQVKPHQVRTFILSTLRASVSYCKAADRRLICKLNQHRAYAPKQHAPGKGDRVKPSPV